MRLSKCLYSFTVLILMLSFFDVSAAEKNPEDPTKIVTKMGFGYDGEWAISGSIGIDEARKINARINEDGDEWRLGGSWLFDFGIVNFNFNRNEYDNGSNSNGYSIGTFVPLTVFGIEPYGWQIFPMAGYNYTEGEIAIPTDEIDDNGLILIPNTSHSGYLGAFSLKPMTDQWTAMAFAGAAKGSDNYSSYWYGGGLSYRYDQQQSVNLYGFMSDSDYGEQEKIGLSYTYEFD